MLWILMIMGPKVKQEKKLKKEEKKKKRIKKVKIIKLKLFLKEMET